MCPNTEFFLVRIFLHSDWIRRDSKYLSVFSPNAGKCGREKTLTKWYWKRKPIEIGTFFIHLTKIFTSKELHCHCVKCLQIRSFFRSVFPHLDWIRRDYLSVFSLNAGKYGTEKTPYLDTFHAVCVNIPWYGFSQTRNFPWTESRFCPYTQKYVSEKIRILA